MHVHRLREWQTMQKPVDDLIVQASTMDGADGWQPFPIGMSYHYNADCPQIGEHQNLVLCAVSSVTDRRRRPSGINRASILAKLASNGIQNTPLSPSDYFRSIPTYKFVISPEGNGVDCHRHYEALIAGCIPIVEEHPGIREKYAGCPVLYTRDYSEITPEYLESVYSQVIDGHFNFERLMMSRYHPSTQAYIKTCGNVWMKRLTGKEWYPSQ